MHNQPSFNIWGRAQYIKSNHHMTYFNVRINPYQLYWSFQFNTTTLISYVSGQNETVITLPYILDFELNKDNFNNKVKTILMML
jgi:hypothetical protein